MLLSEAKRIRTRWTDPHRAKVGSASGW